MPGRTAGHGNGRGNGRRGAASVAEAWQVGAASDATVPTDDRCRTMAEAFRRECPTYSVQPVLPAGPPATPISVTPDVVLRLARIAALGAAGLSRSATDTGVVWVDGDCELLVF